jgi:hypothetical protein
MEHLNFRNTTQCVKMIHQVSSTCWLLKMLVSWGFLQIRPHNVQRNWISAVSVGEATLPLHRLINLWNKMIKPYATKPEYNELQETITIRVPEICWFSVKLIFRHSLNTLKICNTNNLRSHTEVLLILTFDINTRNLNICLKHTTILHKSGFCWVASRLKLYFWNPDNSADD